jgi:hypothetical protein
MDMTQAPIIDQKKQEDPVRAWFSQGVGHELLAKEQEVLDRILGGLYGSHLVQIGIERLKN